MSMKIDNKMKKRISSFALAGAIAVLGIGSTTMAYFTDTVVKENVFTMGSVEATLDEVFDESTAMLVPGAKIKKEINATNTGKSPMYARVHLAVPAALDSGAEDMPQFAAMNNTLHWNFSLASTADGLWNWNADKDGPGYPGNGGNWNFYQTDIDGATYNVYVGTYESAIDAGETTADNLIHQVYLDTGVSNGDLDSVLAVYGDVKIYAALEAGQTSNFEDAYTALNTQFGVPGSYDIDWSNIQ